MTNEQLAVLIQAMISELEAAILEAHGAMPEDAPRIQKRHLKDGARIFSSNPDDYHVFDTDTFEALLPLRDLRDLWNERVGDLRRGKVNDG